MFIVEALADFSQKVMNGEQQQKQQEQDKNGLGQEANELSQQNNQQSQQQNVQIDHQQELPGKRNRTDFHNKQLFDLGNQKDKQQEERNVQQRQKKEEQACKQQETQKKQQIEYTSFCRGDKILVKQTFQNGWWYGHPVKKPQTLGFFPSNYVQTITKPPPPPLSKKNQQQQGQVVYDPEQYGKDWIKSQLDSVQTGPVKSDYYHGIKGYKLVKINQNNQNVLKGNHVQFDVATGLARVPVKDQAPTAKAVRQMGYYFDYHQWNQSRNAGQVQKARPDPRKKKAKKLNLKMMDR